MKWRMSGERVPAGARQVQAGAPAPGPEGGAWAEGSEAGPRRAAWAGRPPARAADRLDGLRETRAVPVDAEHLRAFRGEEPCRRPAEARAGAGDEEHPAGEPHRPHASSTRSAVMIVASSRSVCSKTASTYSAGVPAT